jgi:hypothetical protein
MNPDYIVTSHLFQVHLNITQFRPLTAQMTCCLPVFWTKFWISSHLVMCVTWSPPPYKSPWFGNYNNIQLIVFKRKGVTAHYDPWSIYRTCSATYVTFFSTCGTIPWMGWRPVVRVYLYTHHSTTQKDADTHRCLEWNSNPWSQCSSGQDQHNRQHRTVVTFKIVSLLACRRTSLYPSWCL